MSNSTESLKSQRADFVSMLKHRMRNSVQAATIVLKLLTDEVYGPVNEKQKEILSMLLEDQKNLLDLINVMEDIYNYRNGTKILDLQPVDVELIFETVSNRFKLKLKSEIEFCCQVEGDLFLVADGNEIAKLLRQLIDNAIKHTSTRIEIVAASRDPLTVEISVNDDGKGISSEDIEWLFDRFYEVSSDGKYPPATGIGLCLCAEIARAHGGSISCESKPGDGTTFKIVLPRCRLKDE